MNLPIKANSGLAARDATQSIQQDIMKADDLRAALVKEGDWQSLAWIVNEIRKVKADLDALVRECEENVAAMMPNKKETIDGLGVIERRTTSSRKWESPELLRHLVRSTLDPERTGEVKVEQIMRLIATLEEVLPLTSSLGWRVTPLREHGIDPDFYSETTYGRSNIQIIN